MIGTPTENQFLAKSQSRPLIETAPLIPTADKHE